MESSKGFRSLMLKMVRVETEREYEELWKEYNKELLSEPFVPHKYKVKEDTNFTMTPEFTMIVKKKEQDLENMVEELGGSEDGDKERGVEEEERPGPSGEESQEREEDEGRDDVKLLQQV